MEKDDLRYHIDHSKSIKLGRFEIVQDIVSKGDLKLPYSYVKAKDSVCILPFINNDILLIKQYRHCLNSIEWEIPGGAVDFGELPEEAAVRELREETGYVAASIQELGIYYPSPGAMTEMTYLYTATCHERVDTSLEPLEFIHTEPVSIQAFEAMIRANEFRHGMGLVAWLKYKMMMEKDHAD